MILAETINGMVSEDYKERFIAEYQQLVIRYKGLKKMLDNWDKGELSFVPTCPRSRLNQWQTILPYLRRGRLWKVSICGRYKTMKDNFKKWIKAAAVRAIKTVAQTAIATIGTTAMIREVDWAVVLSTSALAGVLSVLTSIAGLPEVESK